MLDEVVTLVCGRALPARPAWLLDHARYRLRGEVYPGLVAEAGALVEGVVLETLQRGDWRRLDAFEGETYQRVRVIVETADGERLAACTYLLAPSWRARLWRRPWSPAGFRRHHLATYLRGG